jgi:hypothetical protein
MHDLKALCAAIETQAQKVYAQVNQEEKVFIDTQLLLSVRQVRASLCDVALSETERQMQAQRLLDVYECWRYKALGE